LNFLEKFSKSPQTKFFMEIHLVWSELFHAERQTDAQAIRQMWQLLLIIFRTCRNTIWKLIKKPILLSKRDCEDFRNVHWLNTTNIMKSLEDKILYIFRVIYNIFKMLEHILQKRNLKAARVTSVDWLSWSQCLSYLRICRIWCLRNLIYFCHDNYWDSRSSNIMHCQ
jgi:hypothetical protein